MNNKKLISFQNFYKETLPEYINTMPEKGQPTIWLPQQRAINIERFKGYSNDRHFLMTDHDNCHVLAHQLYDIEPNIVVYNPNKPERHQAFWLIRDPVYSQVEVRTSRPYRLLKAAETAYDVKYGCDPHFARYIHKNPLYWNADVDWRHDRTHTLSELSEVVDLNVHRVRTGKRQITAEGRNNTLFHDLRHWGYKNALEARNSMNYDDWFQMVITRSIAKNTFASPLELNEVISVAKSIAEFCYFRYEPKGMVIVTPQYRALQAKRGAIGGKKGSHEDKVKAGKIGGKMSQGGGRPKSFDPELHGKICKLSKDGMGNRAISRYLEISASTVSKYLKMAK